VLAAIPVLLGLALAGGLDPPAAPQRPKPVKRSLASTTWPVEPAFNAGFVVSRDSFAPFAGVSVFVPVIAGVGPAVVARVSGVQSGSLGVVEGVVGVGPAFESNLGGLRGRLTIAPGVLVHGYGFSDEDTGVSVGAAVVVPLEAGLPLGGGVTFNLTIEPGLARGVLHVVDGEIGFSRDRAFVYVGAGLDFGGPP
jgi:hypothetical protein